MENKTRNRKVKYHWGRIFVATFILLFFILFVIVLVIYRSMQNDEFRKRQELDYSFVEIFSQDQSDFHSVEQSSQQSTEQSDQQSSQQSTEQSNQQSSQQSTQQNSQQVQDSSSVPANSSDSPTVPTQTTPETNSQPAAQGDFSNTLFIGDSRTRGLQLYSDLSEATFYTATGLNVTSAMTKPIVTDEAGNQLTVPQALKTRQFDKVYIMLGVNELGWSYSEVFIDKYRQLVQTVRQEQPNAVIYIQSILPVTAEKSASDAIYNNPKIDEYNGLLQQLATEFGEGVSYLNVRQSVMDAQQNLPADASVDGIHLNQPYCLKWADFLRQNS